MLIVDKRTFGKGLALLASFAGIYLLIMSPIFNGMTGLEFSDDFFNKLSKNSSDYFGQVKGTVAKMKGKQVDITITIAKPDIKIEADPTKAQEVANRNAQTAAKALAAAGAQTDVRDNKITVKGDLGAILDFAATNSQTLFSLSVADAAKPEHIEMRKLLGNLWKGLTPMIKALQFARQIDEAKAVDQVIRKGIEPAYNFFGIQGEPVSKNIGLLAGLLTFYVIYTMWYGFGIFFIFEGIGMSMKKSKVKKEA